MRAVASATSRYLASLAAFAALAAFAGTLAASSACFVLVGGTDGYHLPDAGACTSAAGCTGANVCCLSVTVSEAVGGPEGACQSTCTGPQLCAGSQECASEESCQMQQCSASGESFVVQACGAVCSAAAASGD